MGTPKPTRPDRTPKPTRGEKTPRPTKWNPPKTPRPTPDRTPRPTGDKTPRPTPEKTPRPTRKITVDPTRPPKTPRPTVWNPPKTPKPTNPPKTPRPTATYLRTPSPTKPPKTPRPTTYIQPPTPRPTVGGGWGPVKETTEAPNRPMSGCAVELTKNSCKGVEGCVWKEGYPPLEFSEDSDYLLTEGDESFFAVNGSVVRGALNMDYKVMIGVALLISAVLMYAFRQYTMKKEKTVIASEATALLA